MNVEGGDEQPERHELRKMPQSKSVRLANVKSIVPCILLHGGAQHTLGVATRLGGRFRRDARRLEAEGLAKAPQVRVSSRASALRRELPGAHVRVAFILRC